VTWRFETSNGPLGFIKSSDKIIHLLHEISSLWPTKTNNHLEITDYGKDGPTLNCSSHYDNINGAQQQSETCGQLHAPDALTLKQEPSASSEYDDG